MSDEYVWFEGIPFPFVGFSPEYLRDIKENFVLKDEDVLILTFPKSGEEAGPGTETGFAYVPHPFSRQMECFLCALGRQSCALEPFLFRRND